VAGFSTWYHGTTRARARSIARDGLSARDYGSDLFGLGATYHVLARDLDQATAWAYPGTGAGAIVTVHVPDDERAENLTCPDGPCYCGGVLSGLVKALPARMIRSVEHV